MCVYLQKKNVMNLFLSFFKIQSKSIVFINDRTNLVAEETLNVTLNYIRRNPRVGLMIDGSYSVHISGDDASATLDKRTINPDSYTQYRNDIDVSFSDVF